MNDDIINWEGVKFPPSSSDIDRLERNNGHVLLLGVYILAWWFTEGCAVAKLDLQHVVDAKNGAGLLRCCENDTYHFAWICNFSSRFLNSGTNKAQAPKNIRKCCSQPFNRSAFRVGIFVHAPSRSSTSVLLWQPSHVALYRFACRKIATTHIAMILFRI